MLQLAHRGALKQRPENTLESFQQALTDGFDGIELDVRTAKTGEPVVFHDANLKRITGNTKSISELTLTQLQSIRIGNGTIPSLHQVLRNIPACTVLIELKDDISIDAVTTELHTCPIRHTFILGSKKPEIMQSIALQHNNATFKTAFISNKHALPRLFLKRAYKLDYYVQHHWLVNWLGVLLAHAWGMQVIAYPIRSKILKKILLHHGVFAIISDKHL